MVLNKAIHKKTFNKWNFVLFLQFTQNCEFFFSTEKKKKQYVANYFWKQLKTFLDKEIYYLFLIVSKNISIFYFKFLSDVTVVHFPTNFLSFMIVVICRNLETNKQILHFLKFNQNFDIPTLSNLYKSANWSEREIFDMFGIGFYNHSNLRRILTDYGFKGFPLLKTFPVYGFKELRFDLQTQQLIYTPIVLTQKWRNYLFLRQWK